MQFKFDFELLFAFRIMLLYLVCGCIVILNREENCTSLRCIYLGLGKKVSYWISICIFLIYRFCPFELTSLGDTESLIVSGGGAT